MAAVLNDSTEPVVLNNFAEVVVSNYITDPVICEQFRGVRSLFNNIFMDAVYSF